MSRISQLLLTLVLSSLLSSIALAIPGGPQAVIYSGTGLKALKPRLEFFDQAAIISGTTNPTSSAVSANTGSIYLNTSTGLLYRKTDNGSSTNWVAFSSGGTTGVLPVANGGTGLSTGTSGGVLAFTAAGTLASSGALTANQLVKGGGAGVAPSSLAAGSQYQVLRMGASDPAYGSINLDQAAAITGNLPAGNGGNGAYRVESAVVAASCGSTPCTITSQGPTSNWLTSITRASAGNYTANFNSAFSVAPACMVISTIGSHYAIAIPSTSAWNFGTQSLAGAATDSAFMIICAGAR